MLVWLLALAGEGLRAADAVPAAPPPVGLALGETNGLGPRLQCAAPVHDFGQVTGGEVARHEFVFTNVGDGVLEVREVRSSCGCTTAGTWSRQVEPGQSGSIPIELHTEDVSGLLEKPLTVVCNDPFQPEVTLLVRCTVWRPIEVLPSAAVFKVFPDAVTNAFATVRIVNNLESPLVLSAPESNHRALAADLSTNRAGSEFQLIIRAVPPVAPGNVFGRITLRTSAPEVPRLEIPVFALIQEAVSATPSQITLPAGPLPLGLTQVVLMRGAWTNAFKVSAPAVNAAGVGVELKETEAGRCFTVTLTFPTGFALAATQQVVLRAASNHPQFPIVSVPVVQQARPAPGFPPHSP
jgi:hypothetical protein